MTELIPAAVLWDMDGTLVDTEPYWMTAETELIESHGGTWSHEEALTLVGSGLWRTAQILQGKGVDLSEDAIISLLTDRVMGQISESVLWRPGARELLAELRERGIRTALVTMSIGRMAEHVRSLVGFDAFDLVVSGEDVAEAKPHPEAYLAAAAALGVEPADCVAIEDSVAGVTSAAASGAFTIGVPHYLALDDTGADVIWPTLDGRSVDDLWAAFAARGPRMPAGTAPSEEVPA